MKYLFSQLEAEVLDFSKSLNTTTQDVLDFKKVIDEIARQKTELMKVYFEAWSKNEFQKFTELHLVKLSEILSIVCQPKNSKPWRTDKVPSSVSGRILLGTVVVHHSLRTLLGFIYDFFGKYIHKDHRIPKVSHKVFIREVEGYRVRISYTLRHIEPPIVQLLLKPFENFVKLNDHKTWHYVEYCRLLEVEFKKYIDEYPLITEELLIQFLIKINYNAHEFYSYYPIWIKAEEGYPNIGRLENLRREVGQMQIKENMVYVPDMKGIKKQILRWLKEEIHYWKAVELDIESKKAIEEVVGDKSGVTEGKINTRMNSEFMALKTSVEMESGLLFGGGHPKPILQKVLETYNTTDRDNLVYESFRRRYYEHKPATLRAYRDHLHKCLRIVNDKLSGRKSGSNLSHVSEF